MSKIELKIAILLGIAICIGLPQIAATAGGKSEETAPKIPVPEKGFAIVLRAPTSELPQVIQFSKARDGKIEEKPIEGFTVSLPENAPIFFRVDQVNTVLYTVDITVDGKESKTGEPSKFSSDKATKHIQEIKKRVQRVQSRCPDTAGKVKKALDLLESRITAVAELNKNLDGFLYKSEMWQFYKTDPMKSFEEIKSDSRKYVQSILGGLHQGTSQEICDDAEIEIAKARRALMQWDEKSNEASIKIILASLPKNLSDSTNPIAAVFVETAQKLRKIEIAPWYQNDVQTRVLGEKIEYTCVITPAITPNVKDPKLIRKKFVVTVNRIARLQGIKFTFGPFMSTLRDDHYISGKDQKITLGAQDRFAMPLGGLAHVIIFGWNFPRSSAAVALSPGFALGTATAPGELVLNGQAASGVSFLFSGPRGEGDILALTFGGIVKPVKRLNGYWVGDEFPKGSEPTKSVYRIGWFVGLTTNFAFLPRILGLNKDSSSKK